jgi:hypothetical protein
MMGATVIATLLVRRIDGYSIYSARLPRRDDAGVLASPEGT